MNTLTYTIHGSDDVINTLQQCEADSGCEMKQSALEDIYPGFGDLKLLKAKKQELGLLYITF